MSRFLLMAASALLSPSQRLPLAGFCAAPWEARRFLNWLERSTARSILRSSGAAAGKGR